MDLQLRHRLPVGAGRLWANLKASVSIDTRTLAVFRVLVALLILADIALRLRNFSFFYTEDGVIPRALAMDATAETAFSVFYFTTNTTVIAALFGLGALLAIQLLVGYKTRIATICSFLFVVSLDHHNPFVLSYADTLFRLLLFWAMFLPLGERWSIDAVYRTQLSRPRITSVASALILCQIVYMYFLNWYHKSENELWTSGEATPLIMGLDDTTFFLGEFTRNFPTLLQYGGLGWYYLLFSSWLLIFLAGRRRMALVALFMAGHASFAVTVRIGAFAYVAIAGLTLFLQAQFWDDLSRLATAIGVDRSQLRRLKSSLVRFAESVPYYQRETPTAQQIKSGFAFGASTILVGSLLVAGAGMYAPVGGETIEQSAVTEQIETGADSLSISQPTWSVFAPTPRTTDSYYVFPAETADGDRVDVYNERAFTMDRPGKQLQNQYGTYRERFYMNSVRRAALNDRNDSPTILAEYLCGAWADEHDTELTHLNMYQIRESVTLERIDSPEDRDTRSRLLYRHGCGDNEGKHIRTSE